IVLHTHSTARRAPLFPYTTLFRSNAGQIPGLRAQIERIQGQAHALKTRAGIHLVKGRRKPSEQTQVKQERKQFSLEKDWHVLHRSEEHTSELQSRFDLVCRLLLEK